MATRKTTRPSAQPTPQADRDPDALAELHSLVPHDYVRIDDVAYPLLDQDAMTITQRAKLAGLIERVQEIERRVFVEKTPRKTDDADYERVIRELVPMILPTVPAEVVAKAKTGQLAELAAAFFVWVAATSPRIDAATRLLSRTSSQSSPRSTAPASGS